MPDSPHQYTTYAALQLPHSCAAAPATYITAIQILQPTNRPTTTVLPYKADLTAAQLYGDFNPTFLC
jgi:hypothetical protein